MHPTVPTGGAAKPAPRRRSEVPALRLTGRSRWSYVIARLLGLVFLTLPFLLVYAPWQQNLAGKGRVIEYHPANRPQVIQARTDGQILRWHVWEGKQVRAGDPIVDLIDNDPEILRRLEEQLTAAEAKLSAANAKFADYKRQEEAAINSRAAALAAIDERLQITEQAIQAAEQSVIRAGEQIVAGRQNVRAAEASVELATFNERMQKQLFKEKLSSELDVQRSILQLRDSSATLEARQAGLKVLNADEQIAKFNLEIAKQNREALLKDRDRASNDEQSKIQSARALANNAAGEAATARADILRLQRDLERQKAQKIVSPVDGMVLKLEGDYQTGGFVKAGTRLVTIVPKTRPLNRDALGLITGGMAADAATARAQRLAVELYVDGNDVTFIQPGRHVRLQFEGWPAVQFVGWPSVAVGTFGGKVDFVDRFDDGSGRFRVMVVPDERLPESESEGPVIDFLRSTLTYHPENEADNPHKWPDDRFLRQGVQAKGWVLLDTVPLGFEIWRQLNGFPPTTAKPDAKGAKGDKGDKGDDGGKSDDEGKGGK